MRKATMLVGLLVAVGCGSDSFEPSIAGGTPLDTLSAQQATTLCTEAENYTRAAVSPAVETEYNCRSAGVETVLLLPDLPSDAQARAACKVGYDACKRNPPPVEQKQPVAQACANAMAELVNCKATVDTYAACINDAVAWLPQTLPPCDQITTLQVLRIGSGDVSLPSSCQLLGVTCAGLSSTDEAMSSALKLMKR